MGHTSASIHRQERNTCRTPEKKNTKKKTNTKTNYSNPNRDFGHRRSLERGFIARQKNDKRIEHAWLWGGVAVRARPRALTALADGALSPHARASAPAGPPPRAEAPLVRATF